MVTGTCALVTIVALWGLHFAASGRLMDRYVETTADPILAARRTVNGLLVSVAGLVAVAVATNWSSCTPTARHRWPSACCCSVAPPLAAVANGLSVGVRWLVVAIGQRRAALVMAGALSASCLRSPGLLVILLLALVIIVVRERVGDATSRRLLTHQQA